MKIAIGCDHAGFDLKESMKLFLETIEMEILDEGTNGNSPADYPDIAKAVCLDILEGKADRGILICGTGIGMSIAANRHKGIRCALCSEPYSAKMSREHNDSNVLALGGRIIGKQMAEEIIKTWINTEFTGGRHISRIKKLEV